MIKGSISVRVGNFVTTLVMPSKKIEKFGDFVLKGGRGSFQKPNFYIEGF